MRLDLDAIRARFPALERTVGDVPVAYFDSPGGTQVPGAVVDAMERYLVRHNANTHWAYPSSAETDAILAHAKEAMAAFVGGAPEEIAFGANMTSLVYHLTRAIAPTLGSRDEIVTTRLDHQANVAPWHRLAEETGATLREVPFDPATGHLDLDAFAATIGPATRWIAVGAASNALGTITDVAALRPLADAVGARIVVDAVHFAAHHRIDVTALGADVLVCSPYKFYGPHLGALRISEATLPELRPARLPCAGSVGAEVLETGTLSHEAIAGTAAAIEFLAGLGGDGGSLPDRLDRAFSAIEARGAEVARRIGEGLAAIDGVTLFGPPPGGARTSTFGFTVRGRTSESVTRALADAHAIFTSHGDFYATTVIEDLGRAPDGLVRAGAAVFTTDDEVDRLLKGVAALVG
ncbi:MAG: cysteine desulfurase-like protein [Longimicrobiales bacterium]|nr:cysteine desulfurase-like protein [Longimicrobiales bacterium]